MAARSLNQRITILERKMKAQIREIREDVDMRIMLVHEKIVAKLVALEESRDGARRRPILNMTPASDPARDRMSGAKP